MRIILVNPCSFYIGTRPRYVPPFGSRLEGLKLTRTLAVPTLMPTPPHVTTPLIVNFA